jgi:hypothetical protein
LRSFAAVLEELGGGGKRAEKAIRVITEGLLRVGDVEKQLELHLPPRLIIDLTF